MTPEYTRRAKKKKRAPPGLHTTPSSSGYGSNYSTPSSNDGKTSKLFRSMSSDLSEQLALILFYFVTHLNQGCDWALLASLRPQVLRNQSLHTLDRLATWAALTLGFHGFLRGSEFTATTTSTFSKSHDMLLRDIAVESGHLTIVIKASKTDPFRVTSTLPVAATHTSTCPVRAMKAFLRMARQTLAGLSLQRH